ncbi:MAG: DNA polymerase/3'-5' exonuclease PolX [Bacteroidetes bacterium]|nr:DNA polymerase/3'-5' exonuclease PolX [Bacteroidota bacterium]MBL0072117.1 DNA polymerase/3'-5' exonuclease PolX [Bacteroidota bacterium]
MENKEVSKILSTTAKLMELHGQNEFKIRSIQNAAFTVSKLEVPVKQLSEEELAGIKGIGKSISQKIHQLVSEGVMPDLEALLKDTPEGVVEMLSIKGIGPKKVAVLWKELEVLTPGELLYACNENRLVELKGFGIKTQDQIRKAIEFKISNKGLYHFAAIEKQAVVWLDAIKEISLVQDISFSGELRRKCEILTNASFVIACDNFQSCADEVIKILALEEVVSNPSLQIISGKHESEIPVTIAFCAPPEYGKTLFVNTGNDSHVNDVLDKLTNANLQGLSEIAIYEKAGLQFVEPELREGNDEIALAASNTIPELIEYGDLKGSLHNHSTYSDGLSTLREMAIFLRDGGYEYLGICDHSKSAFYANGMKEDRIIQQHKEIDLLNKELAPFRIFKGIESDILHDGSLDYDVQILKSFDFIVASIHSGLKMTEEKATARLLKAIENPYTTILGHPTGRLLLAREGYPIDHKAVIDACAAHHVILELNAHPYRLDIDWRWIRYAIEKGVQISVNPDAHHTNGYHDMYYGVCAGRKGLLTKKMTFNAKSVVEVSQWFESRKATLI